MIRNILIPAFASLLLAASGGAQSLLETGKACQPGFDGKDELEGDAGLPAARIPDHRPPSSRIPPTRAD
jgi:hypothetical protein